MIDAVKYFEIKKRMTKNCTIACNACGLDADKHDGLGCSEFEMDYPEKAVEIVEQFEKEDPLKTCAQVFKEKERITFDYVIQKKMTRADILDAAKQCVCTDRDQQYGSPENNFKTIADMWSAYFTAKLGHKVEIEPHDVAVAMSLLKIARIATGKPKADSWVDGSGYLACGGELQGV